MSDRTADRDAARARRARGAVAGFPLPWTSGEFLRSVGLFSVGVVMWAGGWYVSSEKLVLADQVGPLNLAVGGVVVAMVANVTWFLAGRRAIGARRTTLIRHRRLRLDPVGASRLTGGAPPYRSDEFVAGAGLARFHRADCPLAAGRDWPVTPVEDLQDRLPCGVCRP